MILLQQAYKFCMTGQALPILLQAIFILRLIIIKHLTEKKAGISLLVLWEEMCKRELTNQKDQQIIGMDLMDIIRHCPMGKPLHNQAIIIGMEVLACLITHPSMEVKQIIFLLVLPTITLTG